MGLTRITSDGITDAAIVNADVNASAAIAGTKISPDFGSQNITTSGTLTTTGNALTIQGTHPDLVFIDTNNDDDFKIHLESGTLRIKSDTDNIDRFAINSNGLVGINTTSPVEQLHITNSANCILLLEDTQSANQVGVRYKTTTDEWIAGVHGGQGNAWKLSNHSAFGTNDYLQVNTNGSVNIFANLTITSVNPSIYFTDSGSNPDYRLYNNGGSFKIKDTTNSVDRLTIDSNGVFNIPGNTDFGAGIDVTGNITVTGTVDGVDIAALNTTVGTKLANIVEDTSPQLGGNLDCNGNNISLDNNNQINLGHDNDLIIKVTDTNSTITHNGEGNLFISAEGSGEDVYITAHDDVFIRPQNGQDGIKIYGAGATELYNANARKLSTSAGGLEFFGRSVDCQVNFNDSSNSTRYGGVYGYNESGTDLMAFLKSDGNYSLVVLDTGEVRTYGTVRPNANNSYDLGTTSHRWANVYTNDLHLSNEGGANDIDATWGSFTIQEGAESLFLINRRNGKKYKFNLTEVS